MKSMMNFEKYTKYFFLFILTIGMASCGDDDEVLEEDYTGTITAVDQTISATDNSIMVQSVTVGQDSWLAAVHEEDENTDIFIVEPVMVEEGTSPNIMLDLNEDAGLTMDEEGNEIVLKLYAEDEDGIWDVDDELITLANETITVYMESNTAGVFADFDTNADGDIDEAEFDAFYDYDYTAWDVDEDGVLDETEFYAVNFASADTDDDDVLSEDEWNTGYTTSYSAYFAEDDFSVYDTDGDGSLSDEEWGASLVDSPWFDTYDANTDTFVDDTEFGTGLYNDWDLDNDGFLNEEEYNLYSPYYYSWY